MHSASQARAAFEGVQHTQDGAARLFVLGMCVPLAQIAAQFGQEFIGFFLENGEKIRINRSDVVMPRCRLSGHGGHMGLRLKGRTRQGGRRRSAREFLRFFDQNQILNVQTRRRLRLIILIIEG
jgi:hypothetical protein